MELWQVLDYLGYKVNKDFGLSDDGDGVVYISHWNHSDPQPTIEQIKAAEPFALLVQQTEDAKQREAILARDEVKQAYSNLIPLLEHKDPAIALLASILQKHLLATLGR